jgi:nucleoid DNA-binding protein
MAVKRRSAVATKKASNGAKPVKPIPAKQTKAAIIQTIAESSGVAKKDVSAVLMSLGNTVRGHLMKKGSGEFIIPEVGVKLRRVVRPATKARPGRNPITGESITIKAKPATVKVRALPLKALKEVVH